MMGKSEWRSGIGMWKWHVEAGSGTWKRKWKYMDEEVGSTSENSK
jgi:hypothetical protein